MKEFVNFKLKAYRKKFLETKFREWESPYKVIKNPEESFIETQYQFASTFSKGSTKYVTRNLFSKRNSTFDKSEGLTKTTVICPAPIIKLSTSKGMQVQVNKILCVIFILG